MEKVQYVKRFEKQVVPQVQAEVLAVSSSLRC
jgi:hypothetical protein